MDKQTEVKNQPNKIKGKYIAMQLRMKDIEMNDGNNLLDVLLKTDKNNTMKYTNSLYVTLGMMAYIY